MKALGLDIGHSAVKVALAKKTFHFPTASRAAFAITDEAEARRAAKETVRVGENTYFIGETAVTQGADVGGLSENWIESDEHTALMIAGMNKAIEAGAAKDSLVVMGLPAQLFARHRARLKEIAEKHLETEVIIMSQPFGPFNEWMLNENGIVKDSQALMSESWAIVEVGYFSTDFALIQKNRWTEAATGGCPGVRVAADALQRLISNRLDVSADLNECDEALRSKYIKNFGQKLDVTSLAQEAADTFSSIVVDTSTRLLESYVRKLDGIIVAGGGADLIYDRLKKRWGNVVRAEKPRLSVAEGMRRFGEMQLLVRAATNG